MIRKIFLMIVFAGIFFTLGSMFKARFEYPAWLLSQHNVPDVPLNKNHFAKMEIVARTVCANIYPKPIDGTDCINDLNRGVASSFDPHTVYLDPVEEAEDNKRDDGLLEGIGVTIVKLENKEGYKIHSLVPGGVALMHGIRVGDEIVGVDNIPVSNFQNVLVLARAIRGIPGSRVLLKMRHHDDTKSFTALVTRKAISIPQIEASILEYSGKYYGFIRTHRFGKYFAGELGQKFLELQNSDKKLSGLIVSLEDNPGGLLNEVNNALDLFMDEKSFVLKRSRTGIENITMSGLPHIFGDITNGLPMLVIVNSRSASASEIFAASMQHLGRALIYGTKTYGKGTVQNHFILPDGAGLHVTIAEYLIGTKEDWIPIQCLGVTPDIIRPQEVIAKDEGKQFECMNEKSLASAGPMVNPPKHHSFADAHPSQFKIGLAMIDAYEMQRKKNN